MDDGDFKELNKRIEKFEERYSLRTKKGYAHSTSR